MTTSIPLSEFGGSGAPSAKFENFGDKYSGTITNIEKRPQTDPVSGKVKTFDDGQPMTQWVITIEQSNGESVALWAKGGNYEPQQGTGDSMQNAIAAAVEAAGASSVDVGAMLAVAHTGLTKPKPGLNPARLFQAQYKAPERQPAESLSSSDLFDEPF